MASSFEQHLESLNDDIVACRACPRLVAWREDVARVKRASFASEEYWGKPVPCFGDPNAAKLIVGLAPAAHGANRTGRMFTGDRSGEWLYRALHKAGVANQPTAVSAADGLKLTGVLITAVAHCAPPDNKPTRDEIANCRPFLERVLLSRQWESVLCLGSVAWEAVFRLHGERPPRFGHLALWQIKAIPIVASYHPSQQNTFTGKLTEPMFDAAIGAFLSRREQAAGVIE